MKSNCAKVCNKSVGILMKYSIMHEGKLEYQLVQKCPGWIILAPSHWAPKPDCHPTEVNHLLQPVLTRRTLEEHINNSNSKHKFIPCRVQESSPSLKSSAGPYININTTKCALVNKHHMHPECSCNKWSWKKTYKSHLKHLCKLISNAIFCHCLKILSVIVSTLKISTFWSQWSHCCGSLMWHVLRVSGMSGEDAVERQRLASRLLRGLTNKVQSQRVEGGKKAMLRKFPPAIAQIMLRSQLKKRSQCAERIWV